MWETFAASGRVGRDLAQVPWGSTPLGPPDRWSPSLQAVVRLLLTSRYSMWMAWGPDLTFLCNDAYRRDTLGAKYPWALGRPAAEVWSEIWSDIGPRIESVLSTGSATWDERLLLFLERSGYREETYHTFSYSPLADDAGEVAGMLCVVSEDTREVIAHRRMGTLRDVGTRSIAELSEAETVTAFSRALAESWQDLPFHLVYLYDGDVARLAGTGGFQGPHPAAPVVLPTHDDEQVWPAPAALGELPVVVGDLARRFGELPSGGWPAPPTRAAVLPIRGAQGLSHGFLVAGLNPFRPFDETYADFLSLVAAQLGAAIGDARAYEFERRRAESLARLDQAKTDFFTNISHEFRTPLTLLLGPAEDALADRADPLPVAHRERIDVVRRNGLRLLKLVNTLLDFSRLEAGRSMAEFQPVDLGEYTRELVGMFQGAAERLDLTLEVDCPDLSERVVIDPELWSKLVLNLLSNALKFTPKGGVTVRLHAELDEAVLTVADTGTGIPAAELPHLFERFHRLRNPQARLHEGSGIGLALVAQVAALHGGRADVRSELGEGSEFEIRIPFGDRHLPAGSVVPASDPQAAREVVETFLAETDQYRSDVQATGEAEPWQAPSTLPRVLVVDDNADIRQYVAGLLADSCNVRTEADGLAGLETARSWVPDLVLTDVMMPGLDGFELLSALRRDPRTVAIPVVMLSARGDEGATAEGLEAGADDYLVKPFTSRELRARIGANLELDRARRTREELERSQLLLDQAQRLARLASWSVDLESGVLQASAELFRILDRTPAEVEAAGGPGTFLAAFAHPDDEALVRTVVADVRAGEQIGMEVRLVRPDGSEFVASIRAEAHEDDTGRTLSGSLQDITAARRTAESLTLAEATAVVAAREHEIAEELQRSLLPQREFDLDDLEVATFYRSGVAGTQVGGDWYDVIALQGGRTALVVGDVMGRGVRAAAVMGQVRSAIRAYARLDLPPAEVVALLDGVVCDLFPDQIVTCVYAVFDPGEQSVELANAGHVPPLITCPE